MSEMESVHLCSWQRFWRGFSDAVDSAIQGLAKQLVGDGVCLADGAVRCSVDVGDLGRSATAAEVMLACLRDDTLEQPVQATIREGHRTWPWSLGQVPLLTQRGAFIRGGAEHVLLGQLSHSPGVFLHRRDNSVDATVRASNGMRVDVLLAEEGLVSLSFGGRSMLAWSTLRGVLADTFGEDQIDEKLRTVAGALGWPHSEVGGDRPGATLSIGAIRDDLAGIDLGTLGKMQLDRRLARFGIAPVDGSCLTLDVFEAIVRMLQAFSKKTAEREDRAWELGNLRVRLIDDFLTEALDAWVSTLRRRIIAAWSASDKGPLSLAAALIEANTASPGGSLFTDIMRWWTVGLPICQRIAPEADNFIADAALSRRLTFNGPGGVRIGHDRQWRSFDWSHYGRLCPFDTPQSVDVGVTLSLAAGARVNELGLIESACFAVRDGKVAPELVWVSPWDEGDQHTGWIAFADERDSLEQGRPVYAHRGIQALKIVRPNDVTHIHVSEEAMLSLAASLIPYREHNDSVRMNMACNFVRQALPLVDACAPRSRTGAERELPERFPSARGPRDESRLAFGVDLLVGYVPWKGWNFEDAIVISESASAALTSLHYERLEPVRLARSIVGQETAFMMAIGGRASNDLYEPDRFDSRGIVKEGSRFVPGKPFLLQPSLDWRRRGEPSLLADVGGDASLGPADVHRVQTCDDADGRGWVRVDLRRAHAARVGDKLANRHGHKGVISLILPDPEMPYVVLGDFEGPQCACGERRQHRHLQVLINPLSVISRMNLGQLFETRDSRDAELTPLAEKLACYDPSVGANDRRKLEGDVLVGVQYVMKLDHNAADKLHARATEPAAYSAFVQQPLGGKRHKGGQRLGEMEVWALQAHGVPHLLQEMLTLKSDNPWARRVLFSDAATGGSEAVPELPEALRTFAAICYGLGLDLALTGVDEHRLDPAADRLPPDDAAELRLGLLNAEVFRTTVSKGTVTSPRISGADAVPPVRYDPHGLESEVVFGPEQDFTCACGALRRDATQHGGKKTARRCAKCDTPLLPKRMRRRRMGHIELAKPVPNPFILFSAPLPFEGTSRGVAETLEIAFDPAAARRGTHIVFSEILGERMRARVRWRNRGSDVELAIIWNKAATLLRLCASASDRFKAAMERQVGKSILLGALPGEQSSFGSQLAASIAGAKLASSEAGDIAFDEAVSRLLPELEPGLSGQGLANRINAVVNALLLEAGECPVDFAAALARLSPMSTLLMLGDLPVIPPGLRRPLKLDRVFQKNGLTVAYQAVLHADRDLREVESTDEDAYRRLRTAHFRAVARLMCNQRLPFSARKWDPDARRLRESLSSLLVGKEGLLVGNLLGKRVDFSGRAVIVPDPTLTMDTCKLPFGIAVKLYKPLVLRLLREHGEQAAEEIVARAQRGDEAAMRMVSTVLQELFRDYWVLLNRQPTLHRLGMLAFQPTLGDGSVIALPATVVSGFNADFDGDQMAVFLPLTQLAQDEARRMLPSRHLWRPRDGGFALAISQDIALGLWLEGYGKAAEVAAGFEARPEDVSLASDIESFKELAFKRATQSGVSVSVGDLVELGKRATIGDADDMASALAKASISSSLRRILESGARGNPKTLAYLAGTEFSERQGSNLTAGLRLGERFTQAQAGRGRVVDTKLATAEGGGLTKRLVSWSQHVVVTKEDCGASNGLRVTAPIAGGGLNRWIGGRVLAKEIEELELRAGTVIGNNFDDRITTWLESDSSHAIVVRSPEYCRDTRGVCRACFGVPPWHGRGRDSLGKDALVPIGAAVGLIAAQAAGEPGTQMALRSKHLAGRAHEADEDVIAGFRNLIDAAYTTLGSAPGDLETALAVLDRHLLRNDIEISMIHLDTVLRGRILSRRPGGWIARLAASSGDFAPALADAALQEMRDPLQDPRAQCVVGSQVKQTEAG